MVCGTGASVVVVAVLFSAFWTVSVGEGLSPCVSVGVSLALVVGGIAGTD